jgi:hypothetical protein
MADEMNEGAAYLRALKQATGVPSGAAAAPAREQDRLIDNLSPVQGSESFTSPHPSTGPIESMPAITHPEAALRALIEFFEIHQILMRDEFVRLLKKSQQ